MPKKCTDCDGKNMLRGASSGARRVAGIPPQPEAEAGTRVACGGGVAVPKLEDRG